MKLATTTGDFFSYTCNQAESLKHIRKSGFKYADYNFGCDYKTRSGVYSNNFQNFTDEILKVCDSVGIKLIQAHAPMGKPLEDGGILLADTLVAIDACGAFEIPNLVVHSGYSMGLSKEETFLRNREFFLPLLERAEKYGVNILVENFNKNHVPDGPYWIDNAADLLTMIETVNHPLFHAVWDAGHANMQPMPQNEELAILGSHVRALHIQDNMGDKDSHLVPFLGTMNLDDVMCGLFDIGYAGYFTFEVGDFFTPSFKKRTFERSKLLADSSIVMRDSFERYLYELGKYVLESYNCFEE